MDHFSELLEHYNDEKEFNVSTISLLRQTQESYQLNQSDMARILGVTQGNYSKIVSPKDSRTVTLISYARLLKFISKNPLKKNPSE
ncbi:MAG: hypothetical protein ACPGJV_15080 [Bacteriovoracaceae bacterium]